MHLQTLLSKPDSSRGTEAICHKDNNTMKARLGNQPERRWNTEKKKVIVFWGTFCVAVIC